MGESSLECRKTNILLWKFGDVVLNISASSTDRLIWLAKNRINGVDMNIRPEISAVVYAAFKS